MIITDLCNKQVSPKEIAVLSINKLQILVYNTTSNVQYLHPVYLMFDTDFTYCDLINVRGKLLDRTTRKAINYTMQRLFPGVDNLPILPRLDHFHKLQGTN